MIPSRRTIAQMMPVIMLLGLVISLSPALHFLQAQSQKGAQQKQKKQTPGKKAGPREKKVQPDLGVAIPDALAKNLKWRSIGPANMGGRITAISVYEADPCIYYIATASGGLLKTVNNGNTFVHQFDRENTVSIGDVCVAPSNSDIVWVGTGEHNPRNSVSYGDGVYKSTDGGKSWKHMGLKQSFQIGKILIHPKNPDIVYVGAMGRLYGPNPARGLFKTTNGGQSWQKILYRDENTGIIDMRMHPNDPDTLLVAMWERRRDGFDSFLGKSKPAGLDTYDPVVRWGNNAGLYKTTDGGKNFRRLTEGLPTCKLGRIGIDYHRSDPNIVFAIISSEKIGMGTPPKAVAYLGVQGRDDKNGAKLTQVIQRSPAAKSGLKAGDVVTQFGKNKVKGYDSFVAMIRKHKKGDKVRLTVLRDEKREQLQVTLGSNAGAGGGGRGGFGGPGGAMKNRPYHAFYGGQKANAQKDQGPNGHEYGGVYKSIDGGESWQRVNSLNQRPMYFSEIRVDPSDPERIYALGVSLTGSTNGGRTFKTITRGIHADQHALWIDPKDGRHMIVGTDGGFYVTHDRMKNWDHHNHMAMGQFYHVAVCSKKPYHVYGGLQDNGTWGGPSIGLAGVGPINEDWISVGGGDGFMCRVDPGDPDLIYFASQNGNLRRRNLRTGETASLRPSQGRGKPRYRFNWNTPFILSHQNPKIYYCAAEYVFRSINKGSNLAKISPEITRTKRGSATALAESPRNPQVLWVGTDDGAVHVTRNGGKDWTDVTANVGLPGPRWVATIEASRFADGRAYVAFDGHRSDDDHPYLYVTEDYGVSWKNISSNLPTGSTRCLREDVSNPNLLYVGTEFAVFASTNRGELWTRLNNNLPTVAVHEIAVHPTAGEIVAATHGRSLWILNVTPLRQMTAKALQDEAHLFQPNVVIRWQRKPTRGRTIRRFAGTNPSNGVQIYYSLKKDAEKVTLSVQDISGRELRKLNGKTQRGLHRIVYDLRQTVSRPTGRGGRGGFAGRRGRGGAAGRGGAGGQAFLDRLKQYDKNKDGKLTKQELPENLQRFFFARADANNDNVIDQKELKNIAQNFGRRGGTARGGRGRGGRGGSTIPPGAYRIVLNVDGKETSQVLRVEADPNAPPGARLTEESEESEEEEEQEVRPIGD